MVTDPENPENTALHPIGELYGRWAFNFMIDIACAIAYDFTERPQHYQDVPDDLSRILSGFRSSIGSHPDWPDAQQRIALFRVLGPVCLASAPLREAALIYVEAGTEVNRELLMDAFRDASEVFRNQARTVEGRSLEIGSRQITQIFDKAVQLFQSDAIMRVFHLTPAPKDKGWPVIRNLNGEGTTLAAELIRALDAGNVARTLLGGPKREVAGAPEPKPIRISMTQNKFILLQQAAYYGALSMSGIMNNSHREDDPSPLIGNTYKWTKALQRLIPDVVRVWKDRNYRVRLTDLEWGMIEPHPSEAISLALVGGHEIGALRYSTATVRGEVCCCTGDLPCPTSSNCEVSPGVPSCAGFCFAGL
jgi:hypothetical protein